MVRSQWVVVSAFFWVMSPVQQAEACSCATATGIVSSVPADGDTTVPLNVVPWFMGVDDVNLVDEQGNIVPTVREYVSPPGIECIGAYELVPVQLLLPNTTYRLVAEASDDAGFTAGGAGPMAEVDFVSFTTGEDVLASDVVAAPESQFVAFDAAEFMNSCVYSQIQACLEVQHQGLVDVRLFRAEREVQRYLGAATAFRNLELRGVGEVDCVEVRTRDAAGRVSEQARHCFDGAKLPYLSRDELPDSDSFSLYVNCDTISAFLEGSGTSVDEPAVSSAEPLGSAPLDGHNGVESSSSSNGCAIGPTVARSGVGITGILALLTMGLTFTRRSRRARR